MRSLSNISGLKVPTPGELHSDVALKLDVSSLREIFVECSADGPNEIRNPHIESAVALETKQSAKASSVLFVVTDEDTPQVLLTKRQQGIRFPGHMCFPGGRAEPGETIVETALRESKEEIGLNPSEAEVLGSFGHYYSQAGFRIDPVVAVVAPDTEYYPDASEVASMHWVNLDAMLDPAAYRLKSLVPSRAYFGFDTDEFHVGGPTVSLMIGFFEWLSACR